MNLEQIIREELEDVLGEKKKKKKTKKKDACYHKVKSRYKVWPSAYASGALVKCRKVGAKNWGKSKKESLQIMIEDELSQVISEKQDDLKQKVIKALRDEGGAAGMDALVKHTKASKEEIQKIVSSSNNIKVHKDGDIILMDSIEERDDVRDTYDDEVIKRNKNKRNKAASAMGISLEDLAREELYNVINEKGPKCWDGYKKHDKIKSGPGSCVPMEEVDIEEDLRKWFGRKGAPGKKKGWVDCNTCRKDKKSGRKKCSACGRSTGEKRAKYPSCRPTPSACGERGKHGKKSKAGKKG